MKKIFFILFLLFLVKTSFSSSSFLDLPLENNVLINSQALNAIVKTAKDVYNEQEEITVTFSGLPGNSKDWITLIKPNAPAREYGNWKYTKGKESGSLTFDGMRAGDYEVRVFFNTDFTIQARYPFKVIKKKVTSFEETIENSPARKLYPFIN